MARSAADPKIRVCCPRPEGWRPEVRGGEFERRSVRNGWPMLQLEPGPGGTIRSPQMYTFTFRVLTWDGAWR